MLLSSTWRTRLYGSIAAVLGVVLAVQIANEQFTWPLLVAGGLVGIAVISLQPVPLSTLLLGGALVGYIAGNRGFAQISLLGRFPLFPAEFVLLIAGTIMVVAAALQRRLPLRRDALNVLILLWMLVSSVRLYRDLPLFGVTAVRDYAMVYYASFFFLAQWCAEAGPSRRFLRASLLGACAALALLFPLFVRYPEFFFNWLSIRGTPLVFFKGDLAGTFMSVGAVLFFVRFEERRSWWSLGVSLVLTALVVSTNNRASMLTLVVAAVLLTLGRRWRFAALQLATGVFAALVMLIAAEWRNESWRQTPLYGMYERALSIADPQGKRMYSGEETFNKGDNNLFRFVWWQTCIEEAVADDPWFGLGWGYDLAAPFVRVYYPEGSDEFVTRSPHNVLVTVFARTGVVGLATFLAVVATIIACTVRASRRAPLPAAALWIATCMILVSACLGVVLEGPMGAMVFWTLLGIANVERTLQAVDPAGAVESVEGTDEASLAPPVVVASHVPQSLGR